MTPSSIHPVLAWMDLEMTGLDPARHTIVEIATLITDDQLHIVAEGPDLVVSATPAQLEEMDDVVRKMHTRSGLLNAIAGSTLQLADAGAQTMEFLRQHTPGPGQIPLAGNSIGTDRRFLHAQLPEVEHWFHYRSVDVSTIKELCRRWYPEAARRAPAKQSAHRALDDIRESVAELAHYRETVFRAPQGPSDKTGPAPHDTAGGAAGADSGAAGATAGTDAGTPAPPGAPDDPARQGTARAR